MWADNQPQQQIPSLLLRTQISRSHVGQVARVFADTSSHLAKVEITRRAPACWLWLGCWSNNVANSHTSPGPFDCRVMHSCLVPQCSHPPYWPHHQRRPANCDWMSASYTSGQPSNSRRHPNLMRFVAEEPHYFQDAVPWSLDTCSTQRSPVHLVQLHSALNRDTYLYPSVFLSSVYMFFWQQLISFSDNNIHAAQWADPQWNAEWVENPTRLPTSIPDPGTHTPEWPSQEEPESGSTASAPVSDVSAPACTNGVWPPLRPASVAQNKPSTMSSSTVQSIDPHTDYAAWRFWTMRQPNGCSTPAPISRRATSV